MPRCDPPAAGPRTPADLRMPGLALAAWAGALVVLAPGAFRFAIGVTGLALLAFLLLRRPATRGFCLAAVLVALTVAGVAVQRVDLTGGGPVARLAAESAVVTAGVRVTSDPVVREGRFGDYAMARGQVEWVEGRGERWHTRADVLLIGSEELVRHPLGSVVVASGRLAPAESPGDAAVLAVRPGLRATAPPSALWKGSGHLRASIRAAVAERSEEPRALVPALVDGDDAQMPTETIEEFRTSGLTHLLAVSGTNLTLVVGALLIVARWVGVRGRWLVLVGVIGIAGFVVLARTEPSVVRAAAMGTVGLIAMSSNGTQRGTRALAVAIVGLLLYDPAMAVTPGFVLSVLATAGILLFAPGWRDAMMRWLPRGVAEAVAVPLAAQVACTPVVAVLSGQVSLVAVAANLVAAPAVAPATVFGLAGGVLGMAWPTGGTGLGFVAAAAARWIILVAERAARMPTAAVDWGTSVAAVAALTFLCMVLVVALGPLLRRAGRSLAAGGCLCLVLAMPIPSPGWPPPGWVMVACDVGQGDALVLNAGDGAAVVVDVGPDPALLDRCLDRLGVDRVPLAVLTHFHADHVDGIAGLDDNSRALGEVDVTGLGEPLGGVHAVLAGTTRAADVRVPELGESRRVGAVTLQVLGPVPGVVTPAEGSAANDASVVLLAEVAGVRLLLAGDVEPPAQRALAAQWPSLRVDVLKVPHHGSRHQDFDWLLGLGARLAVISCGVDNDYGHPAPTTLQTFEGAGVTVARTDRDGDVAVLAGPDGIRLETR